MKKYTSLSMSENPDQSASSTRQSLHAIIIDCSMFNHVDVVGVKTLQTIITDFKKQDVRVVFANCKGLFSYQNHIG